MPSATAHKPISVRTRHESSLRSRTLPACVTLLTSNLNCDTFIYLQHFASPIQGAFRRISPRVDGLPQVSGQQRRIPVGVRQTTAAQRQRRKITATGCPPKTRSGIDLGADPTKLRQR